MKQLLTGLAMVAAVGFLAAQQEPPQKPKTPLAAKENGPPTIRFNPTATLIAGAGGDTFSIAVSADGKRVASAGGAYNPALGFINVVDVQSKKELLSLNLIRHPNSIGLSPDGKRVAYADQSGEFKLLEVDGGKTIFAKKLDGSAQVAFAPDGRSIATATAAKSVQIWKVPSGEEQSKLSGATVPLQNIAFSPDGKKLAAGGGDQQYGTIFVWDAATQRLQQKLETNQPVSLIAFSPEGTLIAGASNDNQIRIWEIASGKLKTTVMTQMPSFELAFSPGRLLAGAMADGSIRLWNPESGEEVATVGRHDACHTVAFLNEGKSLVSGGLGRSVKLWDVAGKKELANLHERDVELPVPLAMASTSDFSLVAIATEDSGIILRDGRIGEIKSTLKAHEDTVTCVAFSPDGKMLASGSADKTIKLWDTATAKVRATLNGHAWVYALAFSHDGKTLASGAYDKNVRLWDVHTAAEKGTIEAHRGSVRALAFSPDDKTLASGGSDRFVKLWNVADRELRSAAKGHEGTVRTLSFSSNGKALASGGEDGNVKLWNPETGKELIPTKKVHEEEVTALAFVGERTLVSGDSNGTIFQWDATTGEMIALLPGHPGGVRGFAVARGLDQFISTGADRILKRFRQDTPGPVRLFVGHTGVVQCMSFSPDGQRFVSCGNWPEGDKTLRIWDVQKGTEILKIELPAQAAMALYSPNGKYIASSSGNFNVYLWDAKSGEQIRAFKGHKSGVGGIAFNADGSKLLSCSGDKTVRVWNTATGQELQKFTGHTDMIRRAVFHPDGKHVLSASRDGFVRMWELETANEVKQFKAPGNWADCLAVSRDGKFLAIGAKASIVIEIESGKTVSEFPGHQFGATDVVFSDDGKRLLSCGYDGTARLWDRATGKELYRFRDHREFLWMATFSPDGKWILTGGGGFNAGNGNYNKGSDHAIRLWKMPDEKAITEFSSEN